MTSSRPGTPGGFPGGLSGGLPGGAGERGRERSAYTRFIPREELDGAAVWTPGHLGEAFDGGVAAAPQPMPWHPLPGQGADAALSPLHAAARAAGVTLATPAAAGPAADAATGFAARAASDFAARAGEPSRHAPVAGRPDLEIPPGDADAPDLGAEALVDAGDAPAAETLSAQAEARLDELQARLEAEVAAARQSGYQDGYRDGLVALDSFKSSYAQQVTAQVGQVLQSLDAELRQLEQNAAASVARVAIALARQVVRSELTTHPALVAQVAQEAVATVMHGARQITVKLNPDDHALVAQGCAEVLTASGARLLAEAGVARGGCLVDTEAGGVDARIATRWAAVMQTMGSTAPWQSDDDAPGADA